MDNVREIRKLALELQATEDKEVVKIASILARIKSFFKKIVNPEYREALSVINQESGSLKSMIPGMEKALRGLSSSIKDGDVAGYQTNLATVKSLTREFWTELSKLEKDTNTVIYYTVQEMKEPGFIERFKERLPSSYDVEVGETYRQPLKDFSWFNYLTPDHIYIRSGEGKSAMGKLIGDIQKKLLEAGVDEEKIKGFFADANKVGFLVQEFKKAIVNGTLLEVFPQTPSKKIKNLPYGQTVIFVVTQPFSIQDLGVQMQVGAKLIDLRSSVRPKDRVSLKEVKYVDIMSVTTANRMEELLKLASADFNAYKQLPDSFWEAFVDMSNRLGAKPEDLASVIYAESAFDPKAVNIKGGRPVAKGLNQLIRRTAGAMGMSEAEWDNFENVPAEQQLKYVEKYFRGVGKAMDVGGAWKSAAQLYVANFAPGYVGKAHDPNAVLYQKYDKAGKPTKAYAYNSGLDRMKKGFITVEDLKNYVQGKLPKEILDKIARAKGDAEEMTVPEESTKEVDKLISRLFANDFHEEIIKTAREQEPNNFLVLLMSSDFIASSECARISARVLRKFAKADVVICGSREDNRVELHCSSCQTKPANEFISRVVDMVSKKIEETSGKQIESMVLPEFGSDLQKMSFTELMSNSRAYDLRRIS